MDSSLFSLLSSLFQSHNAQGSPLDQQRQLYRAMMNGKSDEQRVQDYNQAQAQPTMPQQVTVYGGGETPAK